MATLILGAVGGLVGGRIGRAVGAALGSVVDQAVFAPAPRQGPRLADLSVQSSTYGSVIPKLFGRVRVAGTVIWSTDLIESRTRRSNGKGRGSTDTYSYAASFAVLLSARRIVRVERIWADGKLLRGAAGDLKVALGALRIHAGGEDDAPDPLIAAAEWDSAPAYRGRAHAVFENLQLADFGNRIPSLSFEVVADEGAVGIGTALGELAEIAADAGPSMTGIVAVGDTVRAIAEDFARVCALRFDDRNGPAIRVGAAAAVTVDPRDLGASSGAPVERMSRAMAARDSVPATLALGYADPDRDFQPGIQRAARPGPGARSHAVDLPVSLAAPAAAALARDSLARLEAARLRATVSLPSRNLAVRPGDRIDLEGVGWQVVEAAFEGMCVRLGLTRIAPVSGGTLSATPGRARREVDAPIGPSRFVIVDMPPLSDAPATGAVVQIFACGTTPAWRRAMTLVSVDGGTSFVEAGSTGLPAIMGTTNEAVPATTAYLEDRATAIDVTLFNPSDVLHDADESALRGGANLALLGQEILQFGRAEPLGAGAWRLSRLRRGLRGTEDCRVHAAGTTFVLLESGVGVQMPVALAVPGVTAMVGGIGDMPPLARKTCAQTGRALRPLSPVHVTARLSGGDTEIRWIRRSRDGWAWCDGIDVPLAEERESYRIGWAGGVADTGEPRFAYSAALRAADVAAGRTAVTFEIVQVGASALSPPASFTLQIA